VIPTLDRVIDVSVRPSVARAGLHEAAERAGESAETAESAAIDALRSAADLAGAWVPPDDSHLLAALGGSSFPLLAAAYDAGARPLGDVPRWAVQTVAAPDAASGAAAAFGTAASRTVVRALARSLVERPGEPVDLARLALALIGAPVLESDRLARVLSAPGELWPADRLPSVDFIELGRRIVLKWGPVRTEKVLIDAAASAEAGAVLGCTLQYARDVTIHAPARLPNRLVALHDAYRFGIVTDHRPRPAVAEPAVRRPRRVILAEPPPPPPLRHVARRERDPRDRILRPLAGGPRVSAADPLKVTPEIRALHLVECGPVRLAIPNTVGDLKRWSQMLSNCLGDYGPVAVAGTSSIIGVERDGVLKGALELQSTGVVRQFVATANRSMPADARDAVIAILVERGLVDPTHPDNQIWLVDLAKELGRPILATSRETDAAGEIDP
jgi:hypothetical protein